MRLTLEQAWAEAERMRKGRTMLVTVDGRQYEIPEIWIAGFCHSSGLTVYGAIRQWVYQGQLERLSARAAVVA